MMGFVQVTAQYSNAVLLAILPHINEAARSLDLPCDVPITANHVREFRCDPRDGHFGGALFMKNGSTFWFDDGHVSGFESTNCFSALQEPDQIPRLFGRVLVSKGEAISIARAAIEKLGYNVPSIRTAEPHVPPLQKLGTNIVPHYDLSWQESLPGGAELIIARIEVNGETRRIEKFFLPAQAFARRPPTIEITPRQASAVKQKRTPMSGGIPLEKVSAAQEADILRTVLPRFSKLAMNLKLPTPRIITTNHLQEVQCGLVGGTPNVQVILTNGFRFNYQQDSVLGFTGPDAYFSFEWKERGKKRGEFMGPVPSRLEPLESFARNALKATGHFKDTRFLDDKPVFAGGPDMTNKVDITRFMFYWHLPGRLTQTQEDAVPVEMWPTAAVEVDSATMTVHSLAILDVKR